MGKTSYDRAKYIAANAPEEVIDELDRGERTIRGTYDELRAKEKSEIQGFPDGHLSDIDIPNPSTEQIAYWRDAWAELGKKKTDKQLKKWLADPYGDSPAYKAIGNSLAVPVALFVLAGIKQANDMLLRIAQNSAFS
ncbi:hypothetical protein AGMMS49975_06290 [Clostridia bacterium]|nr:hypothetical protein AGMMS49975_06290 [Clostridia bacterium]